MTSLKIWGNTSTRTMRPIWVLHELGVRFELISMGPRTGETQTVDYKALNPKQKIPFMVHNGFALSESTAIANYLVGEFGEDSHMFLPTTAQQRARHDEWCYFIVGELDETSLYILRRHDDLREIYGGSDEVVASTKDYFYKQLNAIAQIKTGSFEFLMDEKFSVADILLTTCLDWMVFYKMEVPEFLKGYHAGMQARPAYSSAFKQNYGFEPRS